MCWATAAQMAFARLYDQLHAEEPFHDGTFSEWSKTASPGTPFKFDDGVTIWAALEDLRPDDDFLSPARDDDVEGGDG